MKVTQIASLLNAIALEQTGGLDTEGNPTVIFAEDLSNVVDMGKTFLNLFTGDNGLDNAVKAIVNKVGKTIIVNREYIGGSPSIIRDSWEYGSILEKIRISLPEASVNNTWELTAGHKYDDILVYDPPEVSATFFNQRNTYDVKMSYASTQLKESFRDAASLNRFFAGVENRIKTAMRFYNDALAQRTINNLIVLARDRRVRLLSMYNASANATLTPEQAIISPEFLRYAAMQIKLYSDYMTRLSVQFNNGDYETFTPKNLQHFVVLSAFAAGIDTYSLSDTYHNEFVKLIDYETVPYWQGIRKAGETTSPAFELDAVSTISAIPSGAAATVTLPYVVGVLFDRDAAAICCENERVTSFYNAENETTKMYYKYDVANLTDPAENCIVFTLD